MIFLKKRLIFICLLSLFLFVLTDGGFAQTPDKQKEYNQALNHAEKLFYEKKYKEAKISFHEALRIFPDKPHPKDRIKEINNILGDSENDEEQAYSLLIKKADAFYDEEKFEDALKKYQDANDLIPGRDYATDRILEIHSTIKSVINKNKKYNIAVNNGNSLLESRKHTEAKDQFQLALELKPDEKYPAEKIREIERSLETEKNYQETITCADEYYVNNDYEKARQEYEKASEIKPDESYPKNLISRIDETIARQRGEDIAMRREYDDLISKADDLFNRFVYSEARNEYKNALKILPGESYPQVRIKEIDNKIAELQATEESYQSAIATADKYFSEQNYQSALSEYQNASNLKPEEEYPKTKISEINQLLTELQATEESYQSAIATADRYFSEQNYQSALSEYQNASNLKPEEEYPKTKISEINQFLAEFQATEELYQSAIATADKYFSDQNYKSALTEYQNASNLKPEEEYPKTRSSEINQLLAELQATEELYRSAIATADQYFSEQNYQSALTEYQNASNLKPDEEYPKTKISEINQLLLAIEKQKEEQRLRYEKLIAGADFNFDAGAFQNAKKSYKEASEILPEENYPKNRIKEIDAILLAELEKIKKEYNKAIAEADRFFNSKVYDNSIKYYISASEIKPEENYPKIRIAEIKRLIEENVVVDVTVDSELIAENSIKKYSFSPVPRRGRKESYILVKARNMSDRDFKMFLNYGKGNSKNGGFVINVPDSQNLRDYIIKVGAQYKWFSEDNNWISIQPEGGDIQISIIKISQE